MIKGSLVPNITFFDKAGELDIEKTKWHMRWMFDKGLDGLFLTGSYGSGPLMTNQERLQVFKAAKEVASEFEGKYLLAHVGCIDTKSTVELAKEVDLLEMDAMSAVPPFYYKHDEERIIQFYRDIIESVRTPVFAYNNPVTSRFTFTLETVHKLQKLGLAGLKDSPLDVGFVSSVFYDAKANKKDFQLILGTSKGWLPYCYMGAQALIGGMNNYTPEIITAMMKYTFDGDTENAEKAYLVMMDLSKKMHFISSTIASHMAIYARGFDAGYPRKPMLLPSFDHPKYREIRDWFLESFDQLGLELETGDDRSAF
jgi:dihydrodipicolinate synthase/N-acetylneuraminate lyase